MKRREFIVHVGGAAVWPFPVRAQLAATPVIGLLSSASPQQYADLVAAFHLGLKEQGYVEGKNVAVEYQWAHGHNDLMPTLVAELVRHQVSVLAILGSTHAALAAKAATQTIPIVFMQAADPVRIGLVGSLNRPGGNVTGIVLLGVETAAKRLELLLELVPAAKSIAYLRNPTNPVFADNETRETQMAAGALGVSLLFVNASNPSEIETAFANFVQQRVGAVLVSGDGFLYAHRDQIVSLAGRYAVPAIYPHAAAGGLISYGTDVSNAWRQTGIYTGRILKGEKPADMPVEQVTKVDLIINLKTAKAIGLMIPPTLIRRADEVIE